MSYPLVIIIILTDTSKIQITNTLGLLSENRAFYYGRLQKYSFIVGQILYVWLLGWLIEYLSSSNLLLFDSKKQSGPICIMY